MENTRPVLSDVLWGTQHWEIDPSSLCKSAIEVKHPHLENTDTDFDNVIFTGLRCSLVLMFSVPFFYVAWSILVSCSYLVNVLSQ